MFTVNTKGNGALTYPIGLITIDELMLSGYASGYINQLAHTYSKYVYWTMTPFSFANWDLSSNLYRLLNNGTLDYSYSITENGVRPVINLASDTEISGGIGTANQPFIIK